MFGGDDDDIFGIFPDMDFDGDHDLIDALILDDILTEEAGTSVKSSRSSLVDDDDNWRDDVEDGTEYLLDPSDYDTEEDYLEALDEAKYGWRDLATVGDEFGITAEDYETEDEYNEAVEEARNAWKNDVEDGYAYSIDPDDYDSKDEYLEALNAAKYGWRDEAEDGSEYGLDPEDYETAEEYEDALHEAKMTTTENSAVEIVVTSAIPMKVIISDKENKANYSYIQIRKNNAKIELKRAEKGEFYGSNEELERCRFIATSKSIAARYLTVDGVYLYAQAIKDNFKLPFEIPDEKEEVETYFETLLQNLFEDNIAYAMKIWEWCIDTFMPYIQYADYKNDLTHSVLLCIGNYIEELPSVIVDHMIKNPCFIEKLILGCTDTLWCIEDFVVLALKAGHTEIAKKIMECAFANPNTDIEDKKRFVKSCIDECSNWEELETMELFQEYVFPIVFNESDVRIKNKISHWQKEMREYIESVERDCEKYEYSRLYAWREKYKDSDINPTYYESEQEYLEAVEERKYGWRKYCTNKFGIDPNDYETRAEYDAVINAEYAKEREARARERAADPRNTTLYKFCKVSVDYPEKPYYYYLTGDHDLKVGDRVIVPFGKDNALTEAVVMSVGECYGSAFPCRIDLIKSVKMII